MGRKAKYFTFEEKSAAARQHKTLYARSERGKLVRQAQNARAYAKHHGRRGPRIRSGDLHALQASSLIQYSTLSLPDSYLFHQSLTGSDLIDQSDLLQWNKAPPYDLPAPPDSPEEDRFHAKPLRPIYNMGEIAELLKEIREAHQRLLTGWDELNARVSSLQACTRHKVMAECYRQWVARRILNYQREDNMLITGKNPYT
ncbi:hypothetical protein DFJ58DRAFT_734329 [Suillus subalutaceus]|uniref:uncharacterized protein n=1 Tax=Suillus subalutaceus TaxID=48586 RepID=UPI001B882F17|nr:uncharacterized protein DFJ58DRAFT_734329 [Suillus subalutaceus]KAG1837516.1 hypothetical protein DFJ58DRAFT_734329 [Suillus subalutaceus]